MLKIRGALLCFQLVTDLAPFRIISRTIFVRHPPVLGNVRRAPVEYEEENNDEVGNCAVYGDNLDHKVLFAQRSLTALRA